MTNVLETQGLGKRYRHNWALQDCTLQLPLGHVVGLIGLNGAGKSTLIRIIAGLLTPDAGEVRVLGEKPDPNSRSFLSHIGFVPQESNLYPDFTVQEMVTLGRKMNAHWDDTLIQQSLDRLQIVHKHKVGKLSGGQRAQLALLLAMAKQPKLLLLDEPLANVDPLARRAFMQLLMEMALDHNVTILISSHVLADLENICDYLVILSSSRVTLAEETDQLLTTYKHLIVPQEYVAELASKHTIVHSRPNGRDCSLILRVQEPLAANPLWQVHAASLEEITLAYLEAHQDSALPVLPEKQEVL